MAGSSNAEAVINWCVDHGEDGDIDDPIPLVAEASGTVGGGGGGGGGDGTVKSYKCNETGRLFACMADVEVSAFTHHPHTTPTQTPTRTQRHPHANPRRSFIACTARITLVYPKYSPTKINLKSEP